MGRAINYLRVSVIDRGNLRCVYCTPAGGVAKRAHTDILRYEGFALIVRVVVIVGKAATYDARQRDHWKSGIGKLEV